MVDGAKWKKALPSCMKEEAENFNNFDRPRVRRFKFNSSMEHINEVAGGEPRSVRRSMARDHSKRVNGLAQ